MSSHPDLGYLSEFWCDMLRPFLNLRVRRRIAMMSKFHLDLEKEVPTFMKSLYEIYGTNVERLWNVVETWGINIPYVCSSLQKTIVHITWKQGLFISGGKRNDTVVFIRYIFSRSMSMWRFEFFSPERTHKYIYTINEQDAGYDLFQFFFIKDDAIRRVELNKIIKNVPETWKRKK